MNYREYFPMLNNNIVYFDNAATTFKPKSVIDKTIEYYSKYCSNAHRGDYNISFKTDELYEETRQEVRKFINAKRVEEIIFTSGTTDSLNKIINGFFSYYLSSGDEVIISKSEHASNVLPWLKLKKDKKIVIKYIPLTKEGNIDINKYKQMINKNTKVISLAYVTNVVGDKRNMKEIIKIAKENNMLSVVDAAQSIAHIKTDVQDLDCDFLAFSAHKMCGPTGVGVMYGKYELLKKVVPTVMGGGMNESFDDSKVVFKSIPSRLEAGTMNIAGIIAFKEAILFLNKIGLENINNYEIKLKKYLVSKLSEIDYIEVYNKDLEGSIVTINAKDIFASDLALYLNSKNICVRAGNHCVKMLKDETGVNNTVRISLFFYNTFNEIDYLVEVLKDKRGLYNF